MFNILASLIEKTTLKESDMEIENQIPKENQFGPSQDKLNEKSKQITGQSEEINKRIEVSWPEETKKKAIEQLTKKKLNRVFLDYQGRIPKQTLSRWKKSKRFQRKKGSGLKPKFPQLEDMLKEWFLIARTRKVIVTDKLLLNKAKKLAKAKELVNFKGSIGYIQKFKKRHDIALRRITTNAKKTVSVMRKLINEYI